MKKLLASLLFLGMATSAFAQITQVSSLVEELGLTKAKKLMTLNASLNYFASGKRGGAGVLTCAVTVDSFYKATKGKPKRMKKFLENYPTAFMVTISNDLVVGFSGKGSVTTTVDMSDPEWVKNNLQANYSFKPLEGLLSDETSKTLYKIPDSPLYPYGGCRTPVRMKASEENTFYIGSRSSNQAPMNIYPMDSDVKDQPARWGYSKTGSLACGDRIVDAYINNDLEIMCDYGSYVEQSLI